MAISKTNKHKEYARYAAHCLDMMVEIKDQETRALNREMAAEWLCLADAVRHPLKRQQAQAQMK
jgi:hypothetical protein